VNVSLSSAILLSLQVAGWTVLVTLPAAVPVAYLLARKQFPAKPLVDALVHLPLVMPPVTTGYLLLVLFGRHGWLGGWLEEGFGIRVAFTTAAAVLASAVVSFPLVVRSIRLAFEFAAPGLEDAARTLGAGPARVFATITLPQAFPGLVSGAVLGFARSLGEFGATITFAGNIPGSTQTIPLAIYANLQVPGREQEALVLVLVSILISFLALTASAMMGRGERTRGKGRHGA
jgi:molybdate transport system permease protein